MDRLALFACPSCPTTQLVRDQVLDARFLPTLLAVLLPLIIMVALACLTIFKPWSR